MSDLIRTRTTAAGLMLLLALLGCDNRNADSGDRSPQQSVASSSLPDWSGTWGITRQNFLVDASTALRAVQKPERLAAFEGIRNKALADNLNLRSLHCQPFTFAGFSGGFEGSIEFLFTPDRVTLIWEGGLVRRLYTDGRALPAEPEPTDAGTSIAHWENQALVVETIGLRPEAPAFGIRGGTDVGVQARITERMFLKDADTLRIDVTLDAPELLTQPGKITYLYRRERGYTMTGVTACPAYDRSLDPASGQQRFDLTPPADLPPPPAN